MALSIFQRKLDLIYLIYFIIHVPIVVLVDVSAMLPRSRRLSISNALFDNLTTNYKDQFFVKGDIAFFNCFRWMEIVYHFPVSLWAIKLLLTDSYKTPLVLLPFAVQTFATTCTCIYDMALWTEVTFEEKLGLTTLYGPYVLLAGFMMMDMFYRLKSKLQIAAQVEDGKKRL